MNPLDHDETGRLPDAEPPSLLEVAVLLIIAAGGGCAAVAWAVALVLSRVV